MRWAAAFTVSIVPSSSMVMMPSTAISTMPRRRAALSASGRRALASGMIGSREAWRRGWKVTGPRSRLFSDEIRMMQARSRGAGEFREQGGKRATSQAPSGVRQSTSRMPSQRFCTGFPTCFLGLSAAGSAYAMVRLILRACESYERHARIGFCFAPHAARCPPKASLEGGGAVMRALLAA